MSQGSKRHLEGLECACGRDLALPGTHSRPVGFGPCGQLFQCAPGTGCQAIKDDIQGYADRVRARVNRDIANAEMPYLMIADVLDTSVPEIAARCEGRTPWNLTQLEFLAALLGVDVIVWLEGEAR